MSRERCFWVTGVVSRYLMGGPVRYDVSGFVAAVVEVAGGGYVCRFCGIHYMELKEYHRFFGLWLISFSESITWS